MATNFLIALATAVGSATLILLVLHVVLKVTMPNAFKEMISTPEQTVERLVAETAKASAVLIDDITLSALSGKQIAAVLDKEQSLRVIISDFTLPAVSALLNTGRQGARATFVLDIKVPKAAKEKALSRQEILSPPGQATPNLGTAVVEKSSGVPNETLCGSAC